MTQGNFLELPSNWLGCSLGDVIDYGSTQKADVSSINKDTWVLELEDIEKQSSKVLKRLTFEARQSKSSKNKFEKGDVLYGKLRPYLNKVVIADYSGVCSSEIIPIRCDDSLIDSRYMFNWLKSSKFLAYVDEVSYGVNMPRLGTKDGKKAPFILAPLPEQKRIVEKLDSLLAQVDTIQQRLNNLPDIIKRFRQSVLAAAVSGKLTEQWRVMNSETVTSVKVLEEHKQRWCETKLKEFKEKNKLPKNDSWKSKYKRPEAVETDKCWALPNQWTWATIDSISFVTKLAGFEYTKFVEYSDDGNLPVIKAENVGLNGFRHKRYSHVFSDKVEHLTRSKISGDEILVVFVGAGVGQVGVVPSDKEYFLGPNVAMVKNVSNLYLTEYMEMYLRSLVGKELMLSFSKGAAQPSLSMGQIRKTSVPLPSLKEQTEIVRLVEQYFALADTLEKNLANAKQRVDNLTQSILAKAFRGELVPQDPNDEPADKLLARIKAARLEAEKLEKAAKKAAKASKK